MINILGTKRVIIIAAIAAVNAVLAAVLFLYLQPGNVQLDRDLRSTRSEISSKRAEIGRLRVEYQQIQEEKSFFEGLENAGFFSDQDRVLARRRMQEIIEQSGVLSASYDIAPRTEVANKKAEEADHVHLQSPITVNIEALDDTDFYKFVYLVENGFPGQTSVQDMQVERVLDVNETVLRSVGTGTNPVLVRGRISFMWHTLVPLARIEQEAAGAF